MNDERKVLLEWHRLFGLLLTDFFTDSPFSVELERDLSQQQQFLDVIILRQGQGTFSDRLPDGLDDLEDHNLLSFKSHRETLDPWSIKELIGHFVAYRKLVSPAPNRLLSEARFRLYAVCARFPHNLANQVPWRERQEGVYDCQWGTDTIRVVVAGQLPRRSHNAPLLLFSASEELRLFGGSIYRRRSEETSVLLEQLLVRYRKEGLTMSYTMEDFRRDYIKEYFPKMPPEERREILESLPPSERREFFESLSPRERRRFFESLPPTERRAFFESLPSTERRAFFESLPSKERRDFFSTLPLEERLAGLSVEEIRDYLDRLSSSQTSKTKKRGRKK
jgi:hypothetical protein